ncbi:hypothetical protein Dimus_039557 [Dionaea muscipula]
MVVLDFFRKGKMLSQVNSTILYLVPKSLNAGLVSEFRPIACCTILYKVIAKMLCNRLVLVLPSIIHQSQSAFVKGRSIVDNILLCQELICGYERKKISPRCLARIDIRKAYDSVSWSFVGDLLDALGFSQKFQHWIMVCVSTVSYTFSINGGLVGFFKGERGIRQGDPLSPYIFVIVMEYFSRCMRCMGRERGFKFHPKCKELGIINLCFADDLMIFSKAHKGSLLLIKKWLVHFGQVSGLEANIGKSSLCFGGVRDGEKGALAATLGFSVSLCSFKYLGVPLSAKKLKVCLFQPIIDKIVARITCWTARCLSYAGRLQLVKSILLSIHVYWSQIFLFPKSVLLSVEAICRAFL